MVIANCLRGILLLLLLIIDIDRFLWVVYVVAAVEAIGGLIGGALFGSFGARWGPLVVLCTATWVQASIDLTQFNAPLLVPVGFPLHAIAIVLVILFGLMSIPLHASYTTLVQVNATESFRGRVFGTIDAIGSFLFVFGLVLSAPLSAAVGIIPVMNLAGLLFVVRGLVIYSDIRRRRNVTEAE